MRRNSAFNTFFLFAPADSAVKIKVRDGKTNPRPMFAVVKFTLNRSFQNIQAFNFVLTVSRIASPDVGHPALACALAAIFGTFEADIFRELLPPSDVMFFVIYRHCFN
jgi:hypothetical protein